MPKTEVHTNCRRMLADLFTPVAVYLRLRDRFRDTILLESTDHDASENSWSFICVHAIAGIEVSNLHRVEWKYPGQRTEHGEINNPADLPRLLEEYMQRYEMAETAIPEERFARGLYGYCTYDAVQFFDTIRLRANRPGDAPSIPLLRYRLYQYVIAFNHFKDELFICENRIKGIKSEIDLLESLVRSKDVPEYPFRTAGEESGNMSDDDYREMVRKGIASCRRGDVFQVVLSRQFRQSFSGDEFNVYRSLRSINPSPYLFYFDYGDYKLMGSSPEAQLVIRDGQAIVHPIAGTFRRTGDAQMDRKETDRLLADAKENAEHVMLVDLARNDLSRVVDDVVVAQYRQIRYYSHVIHLVSEVVGKVRARANPFVLMAATFPAGTLSGAPKFKAMELIDQYEPGARGYYGGAIGFMGFDGSCNHAIMIRTFLSRHNTLVYQAGAGIVAASDPDTELEEVNNKLGALKKAIAWAAQGNGNDIRTDKIKTEPA